MNWKMCKSRIAFFTLFRNNFQHKHDDEFYKHTVLVLMNTRTYCFWSEPGCSFGPIWIFLEDICKTSRHHKLKDDVEIGVKKGVKWLGARVWLKEVAADCLRSRVSKDHETKKYLTLDNQWPPCLGGRQGQGWSVLVMQYKRGEDKYVEHWQNWHKIQKGWGCNSECCGLDGMFVQWPMHWPFVISEAVRRHQKRMILSTSKLSFAGACDDHSFGQALSLDHSAFG